ncbi:TetR/AcrR family transcriptional regulator [Streptomyces althioticus]|uniref:TetR/AcrR family transcriptional regulator n=1 Tax=Streptomyces TaxID=1883 RepID=UPI0033FA2FB1
MTTESSRKTDRDAVRADARRNRERLLTAARAVFAEHGIDAPMATVARRAGVGVATLYRHFPTRDALVRGAFARQMETCGRALTDALAADDAWTGLRQLVETVCALQREERGFPSAFLKAFPDTAPEHARVRGAAERSLATLVRRAQASGAMRPDVHPSDVVVALVAHCGLVAALPDDGAASRRLVAHLLRSFRADPAAGEPLPPPAALTLRGLPAAPAGHRRRPGGA